jgi:parvulin-like peptidyl-prolyl isomerase
LVDEWFLIPECWLSLSLVNSLSLWLLNPLPQTFVSQPGAEVSSAVFASTPPQLLSPIFTANGIHLIYVDEIIQPDLDKEMRSEIIYALFFEWLKQEKI